MTSTPGVLFVTGIAPHSLGEKFLHLYLANQPRSKVIGADLNPDPSSFDSSQLKTFPFDLNPLDCQSGYSEFSSRLCSALQTALTQVEGERIDCLVQAAGVYDFGKFLDHDVVRRRRILGVNLLGHIEVLHAAMSLNASRGADNATALTHIDIGSFQGLHARAERPVYAPSKAAGIDFGGALLEAKEVARSVYFAPAAIDTHMLHFNHWVKKAKGSEKLFECVFSSNRKQYEAVFVQCNEDVLGEAAMRCGLDVGEATRTLERYMAARSEAFRGALGVLSVETCARMLYSIVTSPEEYPSGVYLAYAPNGTGPKLLFAEFPQLSRLRALETIGRSKDSWQ